MAWCQAGHERRKNRVQSEILHSADVVLSTLTGSHKDGVMRLFESDHFDAVVIDECGQAIEAESWIALKHAHKCVLAGDHLQLPPFVKSQRAARLGLDKSLLERVSRVSDGFYVRLLTTQYRMNHVIMDWTSAEMYNGQLVADPSVANHLLKDVEGVEDNEFTRTAMVLIDTESCEYYEQMEDEEDDYKLGRSRTRGDDLNSFWAETRYDCKSIYNKQEVSLVMEYIDMLVLSGVKEDDIAVISPYAAQVAYLMKYLERDYPDVEVKTVDSYQGREKEVVILTMTRSNPERNIGFLSDRRRLNVAVTRARRHVAVICDTETVCCDEFIRGLVVHACKHGLVTKVEDCNSEEKDQALYFLSGLMTDVEGMLEELNSRPLKQTAPEGDSLQDFLLQFAQGFPLKFKHARPIFDYCISYDGRVLTFSRDYDNNFRYAVHAFAETIGLQHYSRGEADLRRISVVTDRVYDGNIRTRTSKNGARKSSELDWSSSSDGDACLLTASQTDGEFENEFKELTLKRKERKVDSGKGGKDLLNLKSKLTRKKAESKNSTAKVENDSPSTPDCRPKKQKLFAEKKANYRDWKVIDEITSPHDAQQSEMKSSHKEKSIVKEDVEMKIDVNVEGGETSPHIPAVPEMKSPSDKGQSIMEDVEKKIDVNAGGEKLEDKRVDDGITPPHTPETEMKSSDKGEPTMTEVVELKIDVEDEQEVDGNTPPHTPETEMKSSDKEESTEVVELKIDVEDEQVVDGKAPLHKPDIEIKSSDKEETVVKEDAGMKIDVNFEGGKDDEVNGKTLPPTSKDVPEENSTNKEPLPASSEVKPTKIEVQMVICEKCTTQVALSNLHEHEERCASFAARRNRMLQDVVTATLPPSVTSSTAGDGNKRKRNKQKTNSSNKKKQAQHRSNNDEDMDDDALLDAAIAENLSCPHPKCSTSTQVTGVVCVHCHKKFCFKHLLPELHGCGVRAKSASRGQFVTAGGQVVYSTSAANSKSKTAQTRRAMLHHELDKKIKTKMNTRSSTTKKKK